MADHTIASAILSTSLAVAFLAYALYLHLVQRRARLRFIALRNCKPPTSSYPHHPLLFGLDFFVENARNAVHRRFTDGVQERFERYGATHVSHILRGRMVNTIDPENLEAVMTTDFDSWTIIPARAKLMVDIFGKGIFAAEGSDWKHSRWLIRRGMSNLEFQPEVLEHHVQNLLSTIEACQGETFDFAQSAFNYSLPVAKDLLIGRDVGKPEVTRQFLDDFASLVHIARVVTVFNRIIPYLANMLFWKTYTPAKTRVLSSVDHQVNKAVQERHEKQYGDKKAWSLIEKLALQIDDVSRIKSEALNMLLGGRDSVGIALSETVYLMARNPTIWMKLRNEVNEVCSDRFPTLAELKNMTFLNNVINEVLRLRPPLSVHGRRATKDTCLPRGGGPSGDDPLFVAKNTYLVYSNYVLHRNPAVFGADADVFRPERWDSITPKRFEYMSFGAGLRNCPGRKMAWVMLAYATVRLAQKVERIVARDDRAWAEGIAFSFFNVHGCWVSMDFVVSGSSYSNIK